MSAHDQSEPVPAGTAPEVAPDGSAEPAPHRSGLDSKGRVKRTRASTAWAGAVALALAAALVVVLVVQNSDPVTVDFLWLSGDLPGAAALLIAAIAGALLVAVPAAVRITQLRRSLRRNG